MHFLDQAFLCSQREISIILQQDFHWLRLLINCEIPTEVEIFTFLSVCFFLYCVLSSFRNAINDFSGIIRSGDKRIIHDVVLDDRDRLIKFWLLCYFLLCMLVLQIFPEKKD